MSPLKRLSEKAFLCANSVMLCVSVVKITRKNIHHRGTELTQRTTEDFFRQTPLGGSSGNISRPKAELQNGS